MKILLTGANGYIGTRLLPALVEAGHHVVALVRSARRLSVPHHLQPHVEIIEADLLKKESLNKIPDDIEVAYYLVHSMSGSSATSFAELERQAAENFVARMEETEVKQLIYLTGLVSEEKLSLHLASRLQVENILKNSSISYTVFRAGIIIGSGSASFEIIRDLVEKLPMMVAPKWVKNRCQPISIVDVIGYLVGTLGKEVCLNQVFDIGGPEKLSYKEMLEILAEERGLKRWIFTVPVLTPRLSSYWLFFVTSTSFPLAKALVDSLKSEAICTNSHIQEVIPRSCLSYRESIQRAFSRIDDNVFFSSWRDAMVLSNLNSNLEEYIEVPKHGCLTDLTEVSFSGDRKGVIETIWKIGGEQGWYFMNWAWEMRGWLDRIFGGVGLRRGRTHLTSLNRGDALDFWRVLLADKEGGHLLLYAEMKLPGEAWLEFQVLEGVLRQKATFRPKGVFGRLYWYLLLPVHHLIFKGMCLGIVNKRKKEA